MTKEAFEREYLLAMGWTGPAVIDKNLSLHYPACVYTFASRKVIALAPEVREAAADVSAANDLDGVLEILFDLDEIEVKHEKVIGFYARYPLIGEKLPRIQDEEALARLMEALNHDDRLRGEVTAQDDFTCCMMENGNVLAAAGAVREGNLCDISVSVHPMARGRGLGTRVTAALIRSIQEAGCAALYRVEQDNLPSMRLARHLGLQRGFVMEGALLRFPTEETRR